jgi:NAD(P)H-hydrate epimerase
MSALSLLTVDQMSRADRAAVAAGVPGVKLMENAGRAVAEAILARWQPRPVLVLAGPGNNGGDGFVAARHLAQAGWPVRLALLGSRKRLTGDAAHHAALWDGEVLDLSPDLVDSEELVIDALFGAGLSRPLEGPARAAIEAAGAKGAPLVAVDVPSGLSGDSGAVLGPVAARADLTVTFFRKKPGHLLLPGRMLCGEVVVAHIGIPEGVLEQIASRTAENGPELWLDSLPRRELVDHKYCFGHAVVLGGATMTGAARLAARAALRVGAGLGAALRVGAGLVSVACPPDVLPIYALASASLITEPLARVGDFAALLADRRKNAVLVGPGAGVCTKTRGHALVALGAGKAVVLDADALTVFAESPGDLFNGIKGPCVLTPHEGEFARLFPDLKGDKLERTRAAAERSGATVLLKGADTVIARPDGLAAINANAPPSLAVAGAGDVLAGLVLGLLAQGMAPFEAAAAAVWLHGAAAATLGPGLLAEDLPEALPQVLRQLI